MRCLDLEGDIKQQLLNGYQKKATASIISSVTGKELPAKLVKSDNHWNQIIEEIKQYDQKLKDDGTCILPDGNLTVDAMDYSENSPFVP